jgi:hypothetical protein
MFFCCKKGCLKSAKKGHKYCKEHELEIKDELVSEYRNETQESIAANLLW